jgi:hypothetical protein
MRRNTPVLAALLLGLSTPALAADHAEAPGAAADPAADIADFYAWHTTDKVVFVLTYAPLTAPGGAATYDADVLYGMHIDNDADGVADQDIWVQYGQNGAGDWAVRVTWGGNEEEFSVDTEGEGDTVKIWTGVADDPFFFDLEGYTQTVSNGSLGFDSSRDSLAGVNVSAIVIEADLATVSGGNAFQTWATTARK